MAEFSPETSNTIAGMVSVFVQALHAVQPSASTTQENCGNGLHQLVSDFDELAGVDRDLVARAMTRLWDSFYEHFDGLQGFLAAEYPERSAYLEQLKITRERMASCGHRLGTHYRQATALMVAYLETAMQQQSFESRVAEAAQRGRVLLRERPPETKPRTQVDFEDSRPALSIVTEHRLPSVSNGDSRWNVGV